MEQRVGRVDRISSLTDRRLSACTAAPGDEELLQVYYPHLRDTVEVLQVERVLERLNTFMRIMHESLANHSNTERSVDVGEALLRPRATLSAIREPLRTAFPIQEEMLHAPDQALAMTESLSEELLSRFLRIPRLSEETQDVYWEARHADNALSGTLPLRTRQQPFTLLIRSVDGRAVVRCVSPIGVRNAELTDGEILTVARDSGVRVTSVLHDQNLKSYNLSIEGDVLLGHPSCDFSRIGGLLRRVAALADRLEEVMLRSDRPMRDFKDDLVTEASYER